MNGFELFPEVGTEVEKRCVEEPYMSRLTMGPRAQREGTGRPTQVVFAVTSGVAADARISQEIFRFTCLTSLQFYVVCNWDSGDV